MKLLLCKDCHDVFKLVREEVRSCRCGKVKGRYLPDGKHAEVNGEGVSLAINNHALAASVQGRNPFFDAWVRPHEGEKNPHTKINREL